MSTTLESPAPGSSAGTRTNRWFWTALGVLAVLVLWTLYAQSRTRTTFARQLQETRDKLAGVETRATALETRATEARSRLAAADATIEALREQLDRSRGLVQQTQSEQRRLTRHFGDHVAEQVTQLGSLTGEMGHVKGEVADNRRDLQRAMGDLGQQSGLIARNEQELEALKRLGQRDYFEFRLTKAQGLTRVGPLSLRLDKTDFARQKYTLTVLADDRQIEKKDKTLLEPVQFYVPRSRSLREIVVYELADGSVVGYVSLPKEVVALQQ